MNFIKLQSEKLDLNVINELVVHESCGAVSYFVGTTRDYFEDKQASATQRNKIVCIKRYLFIIKQVVSLEYEAYDSMATKSLTQICDGLRSKWSDIKNIAIYHRLGLVPVKEASVIIAVSSPHRQTSLEAVALAIEQLKATVPIWKKEMYRQDAEGTTTADEWKANAEWQNGCARH